MFHVQKRGSDRDYLTFLVIGSSVRIMKWMCAHLRADLLADALDLLGLFAGGQRLAQLPNRRGLRAQRNGCRY
jgi:hypothetical protein